MDEVENQVILTTFQAGLLLGDFFFSNTKSSPKIVAELLYNPEVYECKRYSSCEGNDCKRKRDEGTNCPSEKKKET